MEYKNIKIVVASLCIIFCGLTFVSCERNFDEGDDFLTGKWRNIEVLNTPDLSPARYRDYVEYAPYNYLLAKRKITYVIYDYDETQDPQFWFSKKYGNYTIQGDTLIVRDSLSKTIYYNILRIHNDTFQYSDKNGTIYTYARYKSEE